MNTLIPITFKLLDSNEKRIYYISPYWTIQQLYTNISTKIRDDFNININLIELINKRHYEINFNTTIGVHRRSTDIGTHHNIIKTQDIFDEIECNDFDNIFFFSSLLNRGFYFEIIL